jgi:hypothetical protein
MDDMNIWLKFLHCIDNIYPKKILKNACFHIGII